MVSRQKSPPPGLKGRGAAGEPYRLRRALPNVRAAVRIIAARGLPATRSTRPALLPPVEPHRNRERAPSRREQIFRQLLQQRVWYFRCDQRRIARHITNGAAAQ